jgi:hypothetical protein
MRITTGEPRYRLGARTVSDHQHVDVRHAVRLPDWVNRVVLIVRRSLPVFTDKRTFSEPVDTSVSCQNQTHALQQSVSIRSPRRRGRARVHSGNPALRRPSINSFAFDCPPRAIHADIVKPGSTSSRRAAASRASASRPRWANADARQR